MVPVEPTPGVVATEAALAAIEVLTHDRGPMMFFQSGGCCDGSLPICLGDGELIVGEHDVLVGHVGGCPFYIDHRQYEAWKHTQLILDVGEGEPEGFSLSAGEGRHFITRSRVFDDDELRAREPRASPEAVAHKPKLSRRS
jgi:uncharacterized protein (DUF779 family)